MFYYFFYFFFIILDYLSYYIMSTFFDIFHSLRVVLYSCSVYCLVYLKHFFTNVFNVFPPSILSFHGVSNVCHHVSSTRVNFRQINVKFHRTFSRQLRSVYDFQGRIACHIPHPSLSASHYSLW